MAQRSRRDVLKIIAKAFLFAIFPQMAFAARERRLFDLSGLREIYSALGGGEPELSPHVLLEVPEITDTPGGVPVLVRSDIPGTDEISILIERSVTPLALCAQIPYGTEAYIKTAVKIQRTSVVKAVVKAKGKLFYVSKQVKVALPISGSEKIRG